MSTQRVSGAQGGQQISLCRNLTRSRSKCAASLAPYHVHPRPTCRFRYSFQLQPCHPCCRLFEFCKNLSGDYGTLQTCAPFYVSFPELSPTSAPLVKFLLRVRLFRWTSYSNCIRIWELSLLGLPSLPLRFVLSFSPLTGNRAVIFSIHIDILDILTPLGTSD